MVVRPRWGWNDAGTELGEELSHLRAIREPDAPDIHEAIIAAERARRPPPEPPVQSSGSAGP